MKIGSILAVAMALSTGMGVGSIHNAQMRDALPGLFTPFGFTLIFLTVVGFFASLMILRGMNDAGSVARKWMIGGAVYLVLTEAANLVSTLAAEGSLHGWLFHEYLGVIAAPLLLVWVLRPQPVAA